MTDSVFNLGPFKLLLRRRKEFKELCDPKQKVRSDPILLSLISKPHAQEQEMADLQTCQPVDFEIRRLISNFEVHCQPHAIFKCEKIFQ